MPKSAFRDGRLLTAIFLSTLGVVLTFAYYRATAPQSGDTGDATAIALVSQFDGRHQSRRESSQFWAPVNQGDQLFAGDTIRTGDAGELQVRFINAHQTLDIEPDTTIVITNPGEAPTLELLQGHVSVEATGGAAGNAPVTDSSKTLQLKTENGLFAMSEKTTVSKEGSQAVSMTATESVSGPNTFGIQWKEPHGDIAGTLNPDAPKPLSFKWTQKDQAADYKIAIEWGPTRKKMDHHQMSETPGEIKAVLPMGRSYWRWSVYKNGETKPVWSSPSARVVMTGLFPPALVGPANAATLHLKALSDSVTIAWTPNERFNSYHVEVASDALFKKVIYDQKFGPGESEVPFKPTHLGLHYWRLSGQEAESQTWVTTRTRSFIVQTKDAEKTDVQWVTTADQPQFYLGEKPSAELVWSASNAKAVKTYRVRVAATADALATAESQTASEAKFRVSLEDQGDYVAQIEALNSDSEVIGQSPFLPFKASPLPLLRAPSSIGGPQLKADVRGQVRVEWQPVAGASEYSIELKDPAGKAQTTKTAALSQIFNRLRPGTYTARLATLDSHGRIGPQSEPVSIIVSNQSAVKTIHIKKMEVK